MRHSLVAGYRVAADESIQIEDLHSIIATVGDSQEIVPRAGSVCLSSMRFKVAEGQSHGAAELAGEVTFGPQAGGIAP